MKILQTVLSILWSLGASRIYIYIILYIHSNTRLLLCTMRLVLLFVRWENSSPNH